MRQGCRDPTVPGRAYAQVAAPMASCGGIVPSPRPPRSQSASGVLVVPTDRLPGPRQLLIAGAVCCSTAAFSKDDLSRATGVPASRASLAMRFLVANGLAQRAPGRGMYRATDAAVALASKWDSSEAQGRAALGRLWHATWFATAARTRLTSGPGPCLRVSLVAHLMDRAHVDKLRRGGAEALVDIMIAIGLVHSEAVGYLSWTDASAPRGRGPGAEIPTQRAHPPTAPGPTADTPSQESAAAPGAHAEPPYDRQAPTQDLAALMTRTFRIADLAQLTEREVITLHRSLHAITRAAERLRGTEPQPPATGVT